MNGDEFSELCVQSNRKEKNRKEIYSNIPEKDNNIVQF